jgi:hypothetical protein
LSIAETPNKKSVSTTGSGINPDFCGLFIFKS